jgi:hypothetical protein
MRVGHEKRFKSRRRPYGLITHPTAAPQFCQLGSQQFQQSFTVNSDPTKIQNVNDYFNTGKFSPLFSPCQALFSLALLEQPETNFFLCQNACFIRNFGAMPVSVHPGSYSACLLQARSGHQRM